MSKKKLKNKYYENTVLTDNIELLNGDKDTIIKWIYDIHIVEWYSTYLLKKKIDDDLADKIQEIYLMLCEIPQEKWDELYNQGKYAISAYVTGVVHQQLYSSTSAIYYKYGKYNATELTQDDLFWEIYNDEH